ncbi:hypothetical protein HDU93_006538 [Gonapodya sp. JEL0774]|nr:hypothetical protein HDU93_006538 [Gonapodya sp. JEL0774]
MTETPTVVTPSAPIENSITSTVTNGGKPERVWVDIGADADVPVTELESLCMNCHEQSAGSIQEKGVRHTVHIRSKLDLNRQIVKSDTASVRFVEIDFEIPAQRGVLTTVEGLIQTSVDEISADQPLRKVQDEETWRKIEEFLDKLRGLSELKDPAGFHVVVEDPSGNSFVENLVAPSTDPQISTQYFTRTLEQDEQLGIGTAAEEQQEEDGAAVDPHSLNADSANIPEVMHFPASCSSCGAPGETRMHVISIPYFKEMVLMSTSCDACGYKSNEVKAGGAISPKGRRITLKVTDREDLSRDLLKSETCGLQVPEVDLELTFGTLGGRFTTLEGLLVQVRDELASKLPFIEGDSVTAERKRVFDSFISKLASLLNMEVLPWTLVLDDPLGNSYLQNPYAPDPDPNMTVEDYTRTVEQDEEWGISDMKTEGYEDGEKSDEQKGEELI